MQLDNDVDDVQVDRQDVQVCYLSSVSRARTKRQAREEFVV